jgi:hypothetical protein
VVGDTINAVGALVLIALGLLVRTAAG